VPRIPRFDTTFFLYKLANPDQELNINPDECIDAKWIEPLDALNAFVDGKMPLPPPTLYTLYLLAHYNCIDSLRSANAAVPIECKTLLPDIESFSKEGGISLRLPGDSWYMKSEEELTDRSLVHTFSLIKRRFEVQISP
jgi:hypothetical protein